MFQTLLRFNNFLILILCSHVTADSPSLLSSGIFIKISHTRKNDHLYCPPESHWLLLWECNLSPKLILGNFLLLTHLGHVQFKVQFRQFKRVIGSIFLFKKQDFFFTYFLAHMCSQTSILVGFSQICCCSSWYLDEYCYDQLTVQYQSFQLQWQ